MPLRTRSEGRRASKCAPRARSRGRRVRVAYASNQPPPSHLAALGRGRQRCHRAPGGLRLQTPHGLVRPAATLHRCPYAGAGKADRIGSSTIVAMTIGGVPNGSRATVAVFGRWRRPSGHTAVCRSSAPWRRICAMLGLPGARAAVCARRVTERGRGRLIFPLNMFAVLHKKMGRTPCFVFNWVSRTSFSGGSTNLTNLLSC